MMDKYYRTYRFRTPEILVAVLTVISSFVLCSLMFGNKINKISSQLETLEKTEYNYIYVLNYPIHLCDEYVYPDTSITLYSDADQTQRIASVILMQENECDYNESFINCNSGLEENEISISHNLAVKYNLGIGATVFALYPNSSEMHELTVVSVMNTNYDFENPDIDNDIGISIVGYDGQYLSNTNNKALCLSKDSMASEISLHPQLLDRVINKASSYEKVFTQGIHILVIEFVFVLAAMFISELFFFRKSSPRLKRIFLKGAETKKLVSIPLFEHLLFGLLPMVLTIILEMKFIALNSIFTFVYYIEALAIVVCFCAIVLINCYRRTKSAVR